MQAFIEFVSVMDIGYGIAFAISEKIFRNSPFHINIFVCFLMLYCIDFKSFEIIVILLLNIRNQTNRGTLTLLHRSSQSKHENKILQIFVQ